MSKNIRRSLKKAVTSLFLAFVLMLTGSFIPALNGNVSAAEVQNETVDLTITESNGVVRTNWPVTTGIPIPKGNISLISKFRLLDPSQNEIPSEISASSYWPDGSIKWVLVKFKGSVSANQTTTYHLNYGTGVSRQSFSSQLSVTEDSNTVYVDTGALEVTISKTGNFKLFESVVLNGTTIIPTANQSEMKIVDSDANVFKASLAAPDSVEIEENGSLHSILKITGKYVREETLGQQNRTFVMQNGYESGQTGNWSFWERSTGTVTYSADTTIKYEGAQSLKVVNSSIEDYSFTYNTDYNVTQGDEYTLSAAIKCYGVNASSFARVIGKDANGNVVNWNLAKAVAPADLNKWTSVNQTFTIPSGVAKISIDLVSSQGGTTWFDAVQLEEDKPQVKGDLQYIIREHFYEGQNFVRVEHTLYNEMSQPVDIAEMSISNKYNFSGNTQDFFLGSASDDYTGTLGSTVNAYLYQDLLDHYSYYETEQTADLIDEGTESTGLVDLSAGSYGACAIAVSDFVEQYPKYAKAYKGC